MKHSGAGHLQSCDAPAPLPGFPAIEQIPSSCCLRQSSSHEDGGVVAAAARPHQEHNILSGLHLRLDAVEILFAVYRLLIDFEDDVTAAQSSSLAESIGLHIL